MNRSFTWANPKPDKQGITMFRSAYETFDASESSPELVRRYESAFDLTPHLLRIVRRALKRPDDCSPLACAVRRAAAQVETEAARGSTFNDEVRALQVAQRMSALLTPDYRDPPRYGTARETVCV